MEYDFNLIEEKWKKKWEEAHIFEPKMNGKKFLITVPWPYCNGALHIGHGRTYTIGDIVARYRRMIGYNVLYPMGFHISGTPILAFSKKIERGDDQTIKLYRSYLELYGDDPDRVKEFAEPSRIAEYFSEKIINDFTNMGFSIDWTRKFTSGEPIYNKFVEWQFSLLLEKGLIKRGDYPILYDTTEGNPVGEDDIIEGDTDKVSITQFTGVFFEVGRDILIASTLRPETLEGVTNIFINPDASYARIRMEGKTFIVSKEAVVKLEHQRDVEFISDVKPSDLIGMEAVEPLHKRKIPILEGRFVDPDIATGIDYSVPAHSIWDHVALLEIGEKLEYIEVIETEGLPRDIDEIRKKYSIRNISDKEKLDEATKYIYEQEFYRGKIIRGEYSGNYVKDVKDKIASDLIARGLAVPIYDTSRKAETREGSKVIVAVIKGQWFIDYSIEAWKEKVRGLISRMILRPDSLKNQFMQTVEWVRERPCARRRGLGTRLPMDRNWVIESLSDSTIYTAVYTVIPYLRQIEIDKVGNSIFNYIFLGEGDLNNFDDKTKKIVELARKEFEDWYPVDLRHTSYPHISNHLTFYLFNHVAIFPERFWPVGISTGGMVISEGQKMSKSKGNVYPLLTIKRKYGADLFRMYLASNADVWYDVDWRTGEVENYSKKLTRFFAVLQEASIVTEEPETKDLWLLSRMADRIKNAAESYESMRIRDAAVDLFFNSLNDIRDLENFAGKERMLRVVKKFAKEWVLSLSPIMPFIAEEIFSMYGGEGFASVQPFPKIENRFKEYEKQWDFVQSVIEDFRNITKVSHIKPRVMKISFAEDWKWELFEKSKIEDIKSLIKKTEGEKREFLISLMKRRDLDPKVKNEREVLETYREDLERFLNVKIDLTEGADRKSLPGRPSITLT
ncbi:MAG: leucine--tRNA ligase [Thermoplasmatales archaeon]